MNALTLSKNSTIEGFNNFANETNWKSKIIDDRTNDDIFFGVDIAPLKDFVPKSLITNDEQVVYATKEQQIIKVHGSQYSLLTNEVAFNSVNIAINTLFEKGILDPTDAHIKDSVVNKGGKVIREYIFPKHEVTLDDGDKALLRIIVLNSYDGSCNFSLQVGGFRIVCTNGLVTGSKFINLQVRHSGNMEKADFDKVTARLKNAVTSFSEIGDYWKNLQATPITDSKAERLLLPYATTNNELNIEKLMMFNELYKAHKRDLGGTYWALYNTLTAWATHYEVTEKSRQNISNIRLQREAKVVKTLQSREWMND